MIFLSAPASISIAAAQEQQDDNQTTVIAAETIAASAAKAITAAETGQKKNPDNAVAGISAEEAGIISVTSTSASIVASTVCSS